MRHIDEAGVQPVREHPSEALRIHRRTGTSAKPAARDGVQDFLFRESTRRELLEGSRHERCTIRIRHQALARPFRGVEIADRWNEHPAAGSSAIRIPARVRSDRTSLSNCAKAASTPSINFPVDVSSIGSVTERREIPSDFNRARNANCSYFSCSNRVRLYTMTKWTLPLWVRQKFSSFCSSVRSAVFALSPSSLNCSTTSYPSRRQYSSHARSCVGRLRFSVCSFVLTRTYMTAPIIGRSLAPFSACG